MTLLLLLACQGDEPAVARLLEGAFAWRSSRPLLRADPKNLPRSDENPWYAVKDPSIVRFKDRWHLFCTLRKTRGRDGKPPGYIRIGMISFKSWRDAPAAKWDLLDLSLDYHGAPQIFWFAPHRTWYLFYQLHDAVRGIAYGPCYSTTIDITQPNSWSMPTSLYPKKPDSVPGWLDFWVICDDTRAHLFFTSLNGKMWRAETKLADFPRGFGTPEIALRGDIFEASHTYRLKGMKKFLTLVEAQDGRRRYFKAYLADRLDGEWRPLAATKEKPFARRNNVRHDGDAWTESYSHGELIRAGFDQALEVDPADLRFLYQGSMRHGRWRLGLLSPVD